MEATAKSVVTAFLTAVQQGNNEQLPALIHPDIKWSQPGANLISGIKTSVNEVFAMVGKMFEISSNTLRLASIEYISENGNQAACLLRWTATDTSGETLDVYNIDVYTVEEGKITEAVIYSADLLKENSFWK